ncbi:MAG TPA: chemotaxis protein CheB [Terriglobales bacterium]|jgi:two-component system CheB/CheR fusion protein|nr:chemotaxis protein CheB [Terriglobales bacterium]
MTPSRSTRKSEGAGKEKTKGKAANSSGDHARDSFPIVGIGASAGGLEAFTSFLKALSPHPGLSLILVPHLDPSRESAFSQILSRTTSIPVLTAQNGMRVQPDHVYVIPPNCDMTIQAGVLVLSERQEPHTVNTTIDIFLRSLATDQSRNAIGVVLSGTATDGTLGLAAIKGEGGITFAQDPRTAKYDGMPASAISAGAVDFILPPEGIAKELDRIRQHPYVAGKLLEPGAESQETTDAFMGQVFRLLRRATGVDFSEYKPPTIGRRIQRRMALNRVHKLSEYTAILHRDRNEVNSLYQDLLINVTSFFRNPEAFEALKKEVYPAIVKARMTPANPIRIWVPGCSTGEETYSIAISLMEYLGEEKTEVPVQIFGTDLSEGAIQKARVGIYKESIGADISPARLRRFFHKTDAGYQIGKTVRDLCIFSTQNVFSDPPFSRMDLISCRNVMIYLSQALQKKVIPIFHYALNPTGFLIIGSTEGLLGAGSELFDMVDKKQKIYRKRMVSSPVTFGLAVGVPDTSPEGSGGGTPAAKPHDTIKAPIELQREADRLLLAHYAPPAVVVNEQMEILQTRGRTGSFLELPHGKASLHLLKMAKPGLLFELQRVVEEARKSKGESRRPNIHVDTNGESKVVTIRVVPFNPSPQEAGNYLIVFEPQAPEAEHIAVAPVTAGPLTDAERAAKDEQIAQLRQELTATKEYLQSIIEAQEATNEELQSANEEIQSGNEELQSTNEELQTSKEELESANEELHTVNEEMQHRNDMLTQINNDLNNLLNNVDLPMLMVGSDLTVRRFTAQAGTLLGLMNTDIGRPIPRLKFNIDLPWLEQVMVDIVRDAQTQQYDVQDKDKRWYRFRLSPYKTLDNRIDGVVLSVVEVSDAQRDGSDGLPKGKKSAVNNKQARRGK